MDITKKLDIFLSESVTSVENFIRDNMKKGQKTTKQKMWKMVTLVKKGIKEYEFEEAWKGLVDDGFLIPLGNDFYKWSK